MTRAEKMMLAGAMLLALATPTGCANLSNQHAQMMDAMRGVMRDTAARLSTSGAGQVAAGGQVINPGLRVAGGMEYYAEAKYEGVSGQVTASMQGALDRPVPADVQEKIDAIWRDTALTTLEKIRLTRELLVKWEHAVSEPVNVDEPTAPAEDPAADQPDAPSESREAEEPATREEPQSEP